MAGSGNGVVIPVSAVVQNWHQQLAEMQKAVKPIKVDTQLGKGAERDLERITAMIDKVERRGDIRVTNESGLNRWIDEQNQINQAILQFGENLQRVQISDIMPEHLTAQTREFVDELATLKSELDDVSNTNFTKMLENLDSKSSLSKVFERLQITDFKNMGLNEVMDLLNTTFDEASQKSEAFLERYKEIEQTIASSTATKKTLEASQLLQLPDIATAANQIKTELENAFSSIKIDKLESLKYSVETQLKEITGVSEEQRQNVQKALNDLVSAETIQQQEARLADLRTILQSVSNLSCANA